MSRSKRKTHIRQRMLYTGETYQQAFLEAARLDEGQPLIPDAEGAAQRMVESAMMHRLLLGARSQWPNGARPMFPFFVQAVGPSRMGLRVVVPIAEVASFGAALAMRQLADGAGVQADEVSVQHVQNGGVALTVSGAADASIELHCSWKRLCEAVKRHPQVVTVSALNLRFGASDLLDMAPEERGVLSSLLRRAALFTDPVAFDWLCAWHEWLTSGRARTPPKAPSAIVFNLTQTYFGLHPSQLRVLDIDDAPARSQRSGGLRRLDDAVGAPTTRLEKEAAQTGRVLATVTARALSGAVRGNRLRSAILSHREAQEWLPTAAEIDAFLRSLSTLAEDLALAGLWDVRVLIGYQLPLTTRRVDAVIVGADPLTGNDTYVVVEFKQWSHAARYEESRALVAVDGVSGPRLHPGIQVEGYCTYLRELLGSSTGRQITVRGMAYLYNAIDDDVTELLERTSTEQSRVFTKHRRDALIDFLRASFDTRKRGGMAAARLMNSNTRPARYLLTQAATELKEHFQATLLCEQRIAYELVLHEAQRARTADRKTMVVVAGGPGSGKSLLALSLLGELAREGRTALHATGSRSFTQALRRYVGRGSTRLKNLFAYINSFMNAERDGIDVLICDEAHRIRETSANRFTPTSQRRSARPQLDELITAARVPVFLLDEHQAVKPGEIGNIEKITAYAEKLDVDVKFLSLHDQFRNGGSEPLQKWVFNLLGLTGEGPITWEPDGRFDLRVAESPEQMEAFVAAKHAAGETARMTAGYCWPWSDPRPDDSLVPDVRVGDWSRPWNAKSERSVGEAPGSAFWATDPNGFGQVGCVYTAQGFEYDWSGVIIGPDLVAREGRLVPRREELKDPVFRSRNSVSDAEAERFIRNVYKVLMTRGMRGMILYSTDAETRAFLAELVSRKP